MCNFSFCYEKTYCTYTVLLFLAHADHCLHSPPNSSNSSNISSSKSNSSNIPTRSPHSRLPLHLARWAVLRTAGPKAHSRLPLHQASRLILNRSQWWLRRVARTAPRRVQCVFTWRVPLWSYDLLGILWVWRVELWWGGLQIFFWRPFFCDLFPEGNKLQLLFLSMECFILSNN